MQKPTHGGNCVTNHLAGFSGKTESSSVELLSDGSDQLPDRESVSKPIDLEQLSDQADAEYLVNFEGASDSDVNFFLLRIGQICGKEFRKLDDVVEEVKEIKFGAGAPDSEASRFLQKFNKKFGVSADNLDECLALMEVARGAGTTTGCEQCDINKKKTAAFEKQNRELVEENHGLKADIDALKRKISEMESQVDSAKAEMFANEERVTSLKHELAKSEAQVKGLTARVDGLNAAKANAEKAYISLEEFLSAQMAETASLSDQRERLVALLRHQNELCQVYEQSITESAPQEKAKAPPVQSHRSEKANENHTMELLAKICEKVTEKLPGSALQNVVKIRDSLASPDSRVVSIVGAIADHCVDLQQQIDAMEEKAGDAASDVQSAEECGFRILKTFENELRFLERLINSTDLQKVVFYRKETQSSLVLDQEARSELVRHSTAVSQFIEDHIGSYSEEQIEKLAMACDDVNASNVFGIMESESFEEHVRGLIEMVEKNDGLENQFIFDLFFAQAIMNEVLQNHAQSLMSQVEYVTHENQKLQHELTRQEESTAEVKAINKRIIKKLQHKEKRLQKELAKYVQQGSDNEEDVAAKDSRREFSVREAARKSESQQAPVNEASRTKSEPATTMGLSLADIEGQYQAEIDNLKEQLAKRDDNRKDEVSVLRQQFSQQQQMWREKLLFMKKTVEELKEERMSLDQVMAELQQMHQAERSRFAAKVRMFHEQVKDIENRAQAERAEKEELKAKNDALSQSVQELRGSLQGENEQLRSRITSLQDHHEDSVKESQRLKQANEELVIANAEADQKIQELQCQIESLTIMKRAAEIKVKTEAEKFANERRNMSSQLTAKITACRNEFQAQINKQEEMYSEKLQDMVDVSQEYLDASVDISDPVSITMKLTSNLRELEAKKEHYSKVIDDFVSTQEALGITSKMSTSAAVRRIQDELAGQKKENKTLRRAIKQLRTETDKHNRESKLAVSDVKETKEWERWARRIYMIVNDSTATTLPADQLRTSLEEAVLSSIEQKSMLFKLKVLREEKKAFVKFNKPILTEKSRCQPSWRPIIAACAAIKRLQVRAGCLPLVVGSKVSSSILSDTLIPLAKKRKDQRRNRVSSEL